MSRANGRLEAFERQRLDVFRGYGFEGQTRWLTDGAGRRTASIVGGEGKRTVLLVHGSASQAGEWALVAEKLPGRIIIPDWPGCGLSDPIDYRRTDMRRFGQHWLSGVIDALDVDSVDVVGVSMGGYLGLGLALAHPDRVRRLACIGSQPGLSRSAPLILRLFATPVLGPMILRKQPKDAEANRKQVFSNLVAHAERIPTDILELDLAAMALPDAVDSAAGLFRALVNPLLGSRPHLSTADDLPRLSVPTLFLWGAEDNFVRPTKVRGTIERAPAAELRVVEDAGHLLNLENPDRLGAEVTEFLGGAEE